MLNSDVWDRTGTDKLSRQAYGLLLTAFTAAGIAFCAYCSTFTQNWNMKAWDGWTFAGFILAILAASFLGIYIASKSDSPALSCVGYALVAGPFGLLLGPVVAEYSAASVARALALTVAMTVVLGVIGATTPKDLSSWINYLFGGLVLLLVGLFAVPILGAFGLPMAGTMTVLDWAGLVLFGAFVIYDFNRAMRLPYTLKNAIDCAISVFLDMINIFIRMLQLFGNVGGD